MQRREAQTFERAGASPATGTIWSESESGACGSGQAISWRWVKPQVRRPERQDQFGMSTGQADRASVLTSACLRASGALRFAKRTSRLGKLTCKTWEVHSTAFRHCLVDG